MQEPDSVDKDFLLARAHELEATRGTPEPVLGKSISLVTKNVPAVSLGAARSRLQWLWPTVVPCQLC